MTEGYGAFDLRRSVRWLTQSSFVRDVLETFASRVANIVLGLVISVIVARILGPGGRGEYVLAATVGALVAQFGNLGLHASNTYYVSRDRSLLATLTTNSLFMSAAFGVMFAVVVVFRDVSGLGFLPLDGPILLIVVAWVPFALAYLLLQNLLLGIDEVRAFNVVEVGQRVLGVVLIGAVIVLGRVDPPTVFATGLVALALSAIAIWVLLLKRTGTIARPSLPLFRRTFGYGIRGYVAALGSYLVVRVDIFMVGGLVGLDATGQYSIATAMIDFVQMLPVVVGTLLFPRLTAMDDPSERWRRARSVALVVGSGMVVVAVASWVIAPTAIRLLYGNDFVPAAPAFRILVVGSVFLSTNVILNNYFASIGMPPITFLAPLAALSADVPLNLFLVPRFGIRGAAIATAVAYASMLGASLVYLLTRRPWEHT